MNVSARKKSGVDVSVLMLFHARADHFGKVWSEVRKARPARLFLYQDGPRPVDSAGNPVARKEQSKDWQGILACRELVADENIDWECEVFRMYQDRNYGCDPSGFMSQQWAFSLTDKCIVLEDDVVPSQSFFRFCKEMLDRYEDDERITMIAGFNVSPQPSNLHPHPSYFFTRSFSIWGWASWARVINNRDGNYGFVKDPAQFELLQQKAAMYRQRNDMIRMCQDHAASGKQYFESIFWAYMMLHDGLAIMPALNMINNVGLEDGTHYSAQLQLLPRRLRWQFEMPRHEIDFPLEHPDSVVENPDYQKLYYLLNAWNNPWRKVQYSFEELWLNLIHGNFTNIRKSLLNRIRKTLGMQKYG